MRTSRGIRATAWALVAVGAAAPAVRRRLGLPGRRVLAVAAIAPVALVVATPRSRRRDVGVCALQMWAYLAAYEIPHDDPDALAARAHVRYPIVADRVIGLGRIPTVRLQRRFARPGQVNRFERVLVWCHWMWFLVPHASVAYVMLRDERRLPASAARMYAVFDLGAIFYWTVPTAPPWYAATHGALASGPEERSALAVRRMMIEYGEMFWGEQWPALFALLGGNPLAAMPSLHFATSVMAAHLLTETGPVAGAIGWTYAGTLGLALVYLGEHYVTDLLAGAALTETVRRAAPRLTPLSRALARGISRLSP